MRKLPLIIQGGMGVGVSDWRLARAVALAGHLGVISGTGLDITMIRHLEDGDPGGHVRQALDAFPIPGVAAAILERFYRPDGREAHTPYSTVSLLRQDLGIEREGWIMAASFVEVYLARQGHEGGVGINLLTKIQLPTLPTLYGAMLAGVDWILMGAGIPHDIPGALDRLAVHAPATLRLDVAGSSAKDIETLHFDPRQHWPSDPPPLKRPGFLAIVASHGLASMLARKANGIIDGFIVEAPSAGGHNAPPRGRSERNQRGEPIYGDRDVVDLAAVRALGLPFWLAGGTGSPAALAAALAEGATGIQVGTLFAFCNESALEPSLRASLIASARAGMLDVLTDASASPTGYPFKVVIQRDAPQAEVERTRRCDLGYLRTAYRTPSGGVGFRCPSEPVNAYCAKGGTEADTVGRECLCNALVANIGLGQIRSDGTTDPPLITAGDQAKDLATFLAGRTTYSADDVLAYLLSEHTPQ